MTQKIDIDSIPNTPDTRHLRDVAATVNAVIDRLDAAAADATPDAPPPQG